MGDEEPMKETVRNKEMSKLEERATHASNGRGCGTCGPRKKKVIIKTKEGWAPHPDSSEMICCVIVCVTSQVPGYQQHR